LVASPRPISRASTQNLLKSWLLTAVWGNFSQLLSLSLWDPKQVKLSSFLLTDGAAKTLVTLSALILLTRSSCKTQMTTLLSSLAAWWLGWLPNYQKLTTIQKSTELFMIASTIWFSTSSHCSAN
jgi:hypothetical protein